MIKEIIQEELRLTDDQMLRIRIIYGMFDLAVFVFIWYMLLTTNPLAPCARQLFVKLGGF
jgi:hypothetical protein